MCKGHMDKAQMGWAQGWEAEMGGAVGHGGVKMETLYLNNNKKRGLLPSVEFRF